MLINYLDHNLFMIGRLPLASQPGLLPEAILISAMTVIMDGRARTVVVVMWKDAVYY